MTALQTPAHAPAPAPARRSRDEVPARAAGVILHGPMAGSGYTDPPLLARRRDGQVIQLTPMLYAVLAAIDGKRGWEAVAEVVTAVVRRPLTAEDVEYLADAKLRPVGLLRAPDGEEPTTTPRSNPLLALRARIVVSNPATTSRLVRRFAALFQPWVVVPMLLAFTASTWWVLGERGVGAAFEDAVHQPEMLLAVVVGTILSAGFHELGHAAACRYGGASPGAMGAGLYLIWPAFYTDVTDSYRLSRWGRLRVDLGGIYFNAIFSVATFALWVMTLSDALLLLVPVQLFQMLRQLIPVVRFDGYHILADLTGVPDLFARIRPLLLGVVGRGDGSHRRLKRWVQVVVAGWVLVVVPALAGLLLLTVWNLPAILGTAGEGLAFHVDNLRVNAAAGDAARVALGVVGIITVALVPIGMIYLLGRLSTRVTTGIWTATEDRPALRGLAGAGVLALLAATTANWMPTPVPAGPLLAMSVPLERRPAAPTASTPLDDAETRVRGVAASRSRATTPEVDRIRQIAVATAGTSADARPSAPSDSSSTRPSVVVARVDEEWPFPFDPPAEARPGDNVVVAVVTADGQTAHAFEAVLAWLEDDGLIDDANQAVALASCTDCGARAVAFHVMVAVGDTDIVVPQNSAVALNHGCVACATEAVAVQLLVTLEEMPTAEVVAAVEALWAQVAAIEAQSQTTDIAVVHAELARLSEEIREVLLPEDGAGPGDGGGDGDDPAFHGRPGSAAVADDATRGDRGAVLEGQLGPVARPVVPSPADAPAPTDGLEATAGTPSVDGPLEAPSVVAPEPVDGQLEGSGDAAAPSVGSTDGVTPHVDPVTDGEAEGADLPPTTAEPGPTREVAPAQDIAPVHEDAPVPEVSAPLHEASSISGPQVRRG